MTGWKEKSLALHTNTKFDKPNSGIERLALLSETFKMEPSVKAPCGEAQPHAKHKYAAYDGMGVWYLKCPGMPFSYPGIGRSLACGRHKKHDPHVFHYANEPVFCDGRPLVPVTLPRSVKTPEEEVAYRKALKQTSRASTLVSVHEINGERIEVHSDQGPTPEPDWQALSELDPRTLTTGNLIGVIDFLWERHEER